MDIKNKRGQIVGTVVNGVYFTNRKPIHFMRKYQGFGISQEIIDTLTSKGCNKVHINYISPRGMIKYECPLSEWKKSVLTFNFEGEDMQYFVPVRKMVVVQ